MSTLHQLIDQPQLIDSQSTQSSLLDFEIDSNQQILDEQRVKNKESELIQLAQFQHPTEEQLKCPQCICKKINKIPLLSQALRCAICKNYFHSSCLRIEKPKMVFVCPECTIIGMDPLHEITELILYPIIFQSFERKANQLILKFQITKELQQIIYDKLQDVQLNWKKIKEFKPLANNSSLKIR